MQLSKNHENGQWPGGDKAAVLEKTPTEGAKPEKSREDRDGHGMTSQLKEPYQI